MANRNLEKLASIDAQLRLLVPSKVSEDDKLVEYDALLLDRFLDILQDLHGEDLKETVSHWFQYYLYFTKNKSIPSLQFAFWVFFFFFFNLRKNLWLYDTCVCVFFFSICSIVLQIAMHHYWFRSFWLVLTITMC